MTTGISLVRENAASMAPPRSLWVPFPLGRPLGVPNDPEFQHRVVAAALALLTHEHGPILQDFAEEAPQHSTEAALACPVNFAQPEGDTASWKARLTAELAALKPWHDLGKRRRHGRTLTGLTKTSVDTIIDELASHLDTSTLPIDDLTQFKRATEDAKAFYLEAMTAQPGATDPDSLHDLFWTNTALADALVLLSKQVSSTPGLEQFARILVPRSAMVARAATTPRN